ncbi:MAG: formate dehydrogenase accessory sulfurtransferase FdhD [Akkermansiaceae bacterium]|nr:formate dehydrogenase accessory sulfurtransferase FdhD [Akkermansiaceae bacterium]
MNPRSSKSSVHKLSPAGDSLVQDHLAVEEPLQVIVDGRPLAVLMRTPGDDEILVLGFLMTEGIISDLHEVKRIDLEARENHALVFLDDDHECDWERLTRHLFSASSCGLCGKATIDAILQNHPAIECKLEVNRDVLLAASEKMRSVQATFESTGGLHASGIFSKDGELLMLREDIGRHNALDKVIGESLRDSIELNDCFLLLSGRISFELMQKSLAAGISFVAGISAPSSLAVDFAKNSNQTLVGFLRPPTLNLYTGTLADD